MSLKLRASHTTVIDYGGTVTTAQHIAHLLPRRTDRQQVGAVRVAVDPPPQRQHRYVDAFGNPALHFAMEGAHERLTVRATSEVTCEPRPYADPGTGPGWQAARDRFAAGEGGVLLEAYPFLYDSALVGANDTLADYARASFPSGGGLIAGLLDLTQRIHRDFSFDPSATTVATPLDRVFARRRGVCQDFAQLAIGALRSLGLPARYVSGYLRTDSGGEGAPLVGAAASHAWAAAFVPGFGWLDIDPTNNRAQAGDIVVLGWGRDYDDVSPIKGVILGGGSQRVSVSVEVKAGN